MRLKSVVQGRKPWTPLYYFKWDVAGITLRKDVSDNPWRVKFNRKQGTVNVGSFPTLRAAQEAARIFLNSELAARNHALHNLQAQ